MSTYNIVTDVIGKIVSGDVINCPYSGATKSIVLPKGKYRLEVWGAKGGVYASSGSYGTGGYSAGTIRSLGATFFLVAGGSGGGANTAGGYNGGGGSKSYGGSGGGASDIRIGADTYYARVIVAGGGGGSGGWYGGGYGGGINGGSGSGNFYPGGGGGTQNLGGTSGSSAGVFGYCPNNPSSGGGGGGGWYGGGNGADGGTTAGGGGSGYVYTLSTASNYPSGKLLTDDHYLSETVLSAGNVSLTQPDGTTAIGVSGNGYVRITVIEAGVKAPRGLVQTGKDYRSISISWSPETNISTYKVYRDGVSIAITTTTSYVDVNLYPSEKHAYTVSCMDGSDESLQSEPILAETLEAYYAKTIDVKSVEIVPQSVAVRQNIKISVEIKEGIHILYPTKYYCGMTVSGFEPLPQ